MNRLFLLCLVFVTAGFPNRAEGGKDDITKVFEYAQKGKLSALQKSLKGQDINMRLADGKTLLHVAIAYERDNIVNYILGRKRIDVNARTKRGETPLFYASRLGDRQAVLGLLRRRADATLLNKFCHTAADLAAANGNRAIHDLLIRKIRSGKSKIDSECQNKALDKRLTYKERRLVFHRSLMVEIDKPYAYTGVFDSLNLLESDPKLLRQLVGEITGFIQHKALRGDNYVPQVDLEIRLTAIRTLAEAKDPVFRRTFSKEMFEILSTKSCQAAYPDRCRESCGNSSLKQVTGRVLDDPEGFYEACPKCGRCAITEQGHAFRAALLWFELESASRKAYRQKLKQLMKRHIIRPQDLDL